MKDVRITHIGGPTTLIEVHGWRLLTTVGTVVTTTYRRSAAW